MPGASRVPSTDTAWVATTPRSHAPLMPVSSVGFDSRTTVAVKNAYITTTQSTMPATHSAWATLVRPVRIAISLPSTHVPATTVKNPGPRAWLFRSSSTRGKYARSRITNMTVNTA